MRIVRAVPFLALVAALTACPGPPTPPPGALAQGPLAIGGYPGDPIGFLLESRDSLRLADSVVQQLVRLNLRLYQRNAVVQMSLDTIMRNARFNPLERDTTRMPADLKARIEPLLTQRQDQTAAARDTAYAMLTPEQRDKARALFDKAAQRQRNLTPPPAGTPPGRP